VRTQRNVLHSRPPCNLIFIAVAGHLDTDGRAPAD